MLNLVEISSRGCFYGEEGTTVQLIDAFLIVLGQEWTQEEEEKHRISPDLNLTFGV